MPFVPTSLRWQLSRAPLLLTGARDNSPPMFPPFSPETRYLFCTRPAPVRVMDCACPSGGGLWQG